MLGCPISFSHPHPSTRMVKGRIMSPTGLRWDSKGMAGISWGLGVLRGSPEFRNLRAGCGDGRREAEMLTALASTPCAASGSY